MPISSAPTHALGESSGHRRGESVRRGNMPAKHAPLLTSPMSAQPLTVSCRFIEAALLCARWATQPRSQWPIRTTMESACTTTVRIRARPPQQPPTSPILLCPTTMLAWLAHDICFSPSDFQSRLYRNFPSWSVFWSARVSRARCCCSVRGLSENVRSAFSQSVRSSK